MFQYVTNNFVLKLTRRPFNLIATVVSNLNLASLHWSPPEPSNPLPNKTITFHHGNMTATTLTLLEDATLGSCCYPKYVWQRKNQWIEYYFM